MRDHQSSAREAKLGAGTQDATGQDAPSRLADREAEAAVHPVSVVAGLAAHPDPDAAIPVTNAAAAVSLCLARIAANEWQPKRPIPVAGPIGLPTALADLIAGKTL